MPKEEGVVVVGMGRVVEGLLYHTTDLEVEVEVGVGAGVARKW